MTPTARLPAGSRTTTTSSPCFQLTASHQVATPVNWKQGEDVIIVPTVSDEDAKKKFPGGWKTLKPYLRVVAQPGK